MNAPAQAIARYVTEIDKICRAGNATEHSYQLALQMLFESCFTSLKTPLKGSFTSPKMPLKDSFTSFKNGLAITNEPKHISCGAPDYMDAIAALFNSASVEDILNEFGKANQDPYIHFYETFLAKYDPEIRETRGVYYTPLPVVKFIVRAVDDILKTEFNIKAGLADHSKLEDADSFHKVQILDPAAGTGTFLAEVIDKIHEHFAGNKGAWQGYCVDHLIPRINGFEIMTASYAMAHFNLNMTLKETGFHWDEWQNGESMWLRVYLANALEKAPEGAPELFMAQWLAREAEEARRAERDVPVMVVLGNPPYNVSTQNKNDWIDGLIADYKQGLNEKKINLDDDYIKFIRYGQYLIENSKNGIMAYISNNSFIDGITHRGMRETLLKSFNKIFIFDLHGNSRRRETTPDGKSDGNVFDIRQGVSINIFIKTSEKTGLAKVYHCGLFGKREEKYRFLHEHDFYSLKWQVLHPEAPYYFFVPKNFDNQHEYEKGFLITELFTVYNNAIKTDRDALFIDMDKEILERKMLKLLSGKYDKQFIEDYNVKDSSSYKLTKLISNNQYEKSNISIIQYRPFDYQYIYYKQGLTSRPAFSVMKHFKHDNISLLTCRQQSVIGFQHIFVSKTFSEVGTVSSKPGETTYVFPLYLCQETGDLSETEERRPNLNNDIVKTIAQKTRLQFANDKTGDDKTLAPIDILDYIYAVLHSHAYCAKYKELLKIDFPRIPYPESAEQFCRLAALGTVLRQLHLMENVSPAHDKATFPVAGSNEIAALKYEKGKVFINRSQYFDNVSLEAWEFCIGGYQPARKWLKDRKGRTLIFDEIEHYRKIITVLSFTADIQRQIDLKN
jgi:predicted helicase